MGAALSICLRRLISRMLSVDDMTTNGSQTLS